MNGTRKTASSVIAKTSDQNSNWWLPIKLVVKFLMILVGGLLVYTGYLHFRNPYAFLSSILQYELTGFGLSKQLAIVFPVAHLTIGLFLLTRTFVQGSLVIAASIFTLYFVAQLSALIRGLVIDCGCFGIYSHEVSWSSVASVAGLSSLCWIAAIFRL